MCIQWSRLIQFINIWPLWNIRSKVKRLKNNLSDNTSTMKGVIGSVSSFSEKCIFSPSWTNVGNIRGKEKLKDVNFWERYFGSKKPLSELCISNNIWKSIAESKASNCSSDQTIHCWKKCENKERKKWTG